MSASTITPHVPAGPHAAAGWLNQGDCRLADLRALVEQQTRLEDYPTAEGVQSNVLVYGSRLRDRIVDPQGRREVQAELAHALLEGPGIVVVKAAYPDPAVIDRASAAFHELIADQKARGVTVGDHFAKPGANDRVWGALEKLAAAHPEVFAEYYANDVVAMVCAAWLGPNYQIVSDLNVVNPGGAAQTGHRDFHLGFMSLDLAARYPAHVHRLSPLMTLQAAVAHCDMPLETGPTMYLPHSQKYLAGYLAIELPDFQAYFDTSHVQLPLQKGDAVFFNPALYHAAGTNRTSDVRRMANLLQVSSAFGRALGTVDRVAVCTSLYPTLRALRASGIDDHMLDNIIAAGAEGYPFPTNLDRDPPVGGLNPQTQAQLLRQALDEEWDQAAFVSALDAQHDRHQSGTI